MRSFRCVKACSCSISKPFLHKYLFVILPCPFTLLSGAWICVRDWLRSIRGHSPVDILMVWALSDRLMPVTRISNNNVKMGILGCWCSASFKLSPGLNSLVVPGHLIGFGLDGHTSGVQSPLTRPCYALVKIYRRIQWGIFHLALSR